MNYTRLKTPVILLLLVSALGCTRQEKQSVVEAQTVFGLITMVEWYELEHPRVPITNLVQVFSSLEREYPHKWHQQFRAYREHAGFTNSFFEKYVFFPPGITNSHFPGAILFMNATPYPGPHGEMERTVISKEQGIYHRRTPREQNVENWFQEAGIAIPKPLIMPAPPPAPPEADPMPFSTKVSRFFMRAAGYIGISEHWVLLRNVTIGTGTVALALLGTYLWFSRARRR